MDSRHLRAFLAAADNGGISAAAAELGYAQSSVSDQIKSLERELGVSLLVRSSSGAKPTEAGKRLVPYARQMIDLDERLRRDVVGQRPVLRIGVLETLASQWLPEVVAALQQGAAGPGTCADVSLTVASRRQLNEDLERGRLDVVFLFEKTEHRLPGPRAVVAHDRVALVAAPDHPLTRSAGITPELLREAEFLVAEAGCTSEMLYDQYGRDLAKRGRVAMITGSLGALLRLVALGRGIAVLPFMCVARDLAAGDLVRLEYPYPLMPLGIEARWRTGLGQAERPLQGLLRLARRHQPQYSDAGGFTRMIRKGVAVQAVPAQAVPTQTAATRTPAA
jgi:DNA-binding transcriptional LysR family regulator